MNVVKEIERINAAEFAAGIVGGMPGSWHERYKNSAWAYVGGLPTELTEGDVLCVMSQWGEVEDINLVRDKATNKPMGFAFVKYEDQRSTILAVDNFNGVKLLGRTLRVDHVEQYKLPKEVREREEQALEADPDAMPDIGPGHAYKAKDLASNYTIDAGIDVWAAPAPKAAAAAAAAAATAAAADGAGAEEEHGGSKAKKEKHKKEKHKKEKKSKEEKHKKQKRDERGDGDYPLLPLTHSGSGGGSSSSSSSSSVFCAPAAAVVAVPHRDMNATRWSREGGAPDAYPSRSAFPASADPNAAASWRGNRDPGASQGGAGYGYGSGGRAPGGGFGAKRPYEGSSSSSSSSSSGGGSSGGGNTGAPRREIGGIAGYNRQR